MAAATVSAGTAVIGTLDRYVSAPNASLLYVPAILLTAVYFGTGPSLAAAALAVAQYDFFLLKPLHTLSIGRAEDVVAFAIFMLVAVLTSQLAAAARVRADSAQRRAKESATLYELSQALMSAQDVDGVLRAITRRIVEAFEVDRCAIFVPGTEHTLRLAAETRRGGLRSRASESTVNWAFQQGTELALPSDKSARLYVPLRTDDLVMGVMEVGLKRSGMALEIEERRLVMSFAAQASLLIAKAQSDDHRRRLEVIEESDKLKSALLNAVSHDFRTPLASIKASATALLSFDAPWRMDEAREFLHAIDHETDRLNRLVGNLLDLSRIEAGVLHPALEWYEVREVFEAVQLSARALFESRPIIVSIDDSPRPVRIDLLRVEELVINLLENAVKYSPDDSHVELRGREDGNALVLEVIDHGPGICEDQRERVFEAFYQGREPGDRRPGTGLGLAICRGVAEAHGGTIDVTETPGGGATFTVRLPLVDVGERVQT